MLQWMGGSRRKVTTSRRSTHKRQKQYFEQRKRQQQQQTSDSENCANGIPSCTQYSDNNRSLDILSLANITTVSQQQNTSSVNEARDCAEGDDFNLNHQSLYIPVVHVSNEIIPVDPPELNEEKSRYHTSFVSGTSSSYHSVAEYSPKVSACLPDHTEDLVGKSSKLSSVQMSSTQEVSVFDLLGDDGTNIDAGEKSVHAQEAHVAFAVEGLGQVETETPVHSPEIPRRSLPDGFFSPRKAKRRLLASRDLDYGLDALGTQLDIMTEDIDFLPYDNRIKQPFLSREVMNNTKDPNPEFVNFRKFSQFNWNDSPLWRVGINDELCCNISDRNIWNEGPSFLDGNTNDLVEFESFHENYMDQGNVDDDDCFGSKDIWKQDFSFEKWNIQKKRCNSKRTENLDIPELPVHYVKHQITEDPPVVIIADMTWNCAIGNDVKDAVSGLGEDTRESVSRLSEESCSSTAVWGDGTKKPAENQ